jgi:hypothetical protein
VLHLLKASGVSVAELALRRFIGEHGITMLNVAGPRASCARARPPDDSASATASLGKLVCCCAPPCDSKPIRAPMTGSGAGP